MTNHTGRTKPLSLLAGALVSTYIIYFVCRHFYQRGVALLVISGLPGVKLLDLVLPGSYYLESIVATPTDSPNFLWMNLGFYGEHRFYMMSAWIQLSVYFGLVANGLLTRLAVRRQAALTANETIPGAWMRPNDDSPASERPNHSSQTTHRAFKLVGGILMTSIGIGLLYVASLFGLNGGELAGVPALVFIWLGLFFFLAKKGWALALLSIASALMLGFVVLGWIGIRTALFLRFS